jgi:cytochrome c biogenesis protein CcmG, thiol:disulfide interchange protein DsbE
MYRPDYDTGKRRRNPFILPTILLGLLIGVVFGALTGMIPVGRFSDWWNWAPVSAHPAIEATAITEAQIAVTAAPVTPIPTNAGISRNTSLLAPKFGLPDLFNDSLSHSLVDYEGQPVILNFWASWCVPCKEEMPALQRAYEKYRDAGLVVLGVNQTFVDGLDAAREFVNELALTFPNVRDDTGSTSEGLYRIIGLPTSVFITPNGEIAHKQIGQMTDEQIDKFSQQLVTGETIGP